MGEEASARLIRLLSAWAGSGGGHHEQEVASAHSTPIYVTSQRPPRALCYMYGVRRLHAMRMRTTARALVRWCQALSLRIVRQRFFVSVTLNFLNLLRYLAYLPQQDLQYKGIV